MKGQETKGIAIRYFTRSSLDRFIEKVPEFLDSEEIRIEKIRKPGRQGSDWDYPARRLMKQKFTDWLKREAGLSEIEIEGILFAEGISCVPPSRFSNDFFGSRCNPDLVLTSSDGYTVAFELDHGKSGADLRKALTKASFNVIGGGFKRSLILFFDETSQAQEKIKFDPHHPVLKLYDEKFFTSVIFVKSPSV